jgi:modulator of FtsH protease
VLYDGHLWGSFFATSASVAATLTGLLFVALSINLQRILTHPLLPQRAAETLATFAMVLFTALIGLIPEQSGHALGLEMLGLSLPVWIASTLLQRRVLRPDTRSPPHWKVVRIVALQLAALPFVVGSVGLILHAGGGLGWIAAGTVLALATGILNAWVLMVEIVR